MRLVQVMWLEAVKNNAHTTTVLSDAETQAYEQETQARCMQRTSAAVQSQICTVHTIRASYGSWRSREGAVKQRRRIFKNDENSKGRTLFS